MPDTAVARTTDFRAVAGLTGQRLLTWVTPVSRAAPVAFKVPMLRAPTILVAVVLVLLAVGIVMLASTTSGDRTGKKAVPAKVVKRQLAWLAIAVAAGVGSAMLDYHRWRQFAIPLAAATAIALAAVFVPHVGWGTKGARRWVQAGPVRGQPSEMAKLASVVMLASWMTYAGARAARLKEGLLKPLGMMGVLLALIMAEPDFGTTFLIGATGMAVMFVGGARIPHLLTAGAAGAVGFVVAILHDPVRMRRFFAFIDPDRYPKEAYQLRQSLDAFILGGVSGTGLGGSVQKHGYLPEARTDFIFSIVGEELGLRITILVLVLFVVFFICGTAISTRAPDTFGRLLGFGITTTTALQAAMNIAVVTGCMPTKGLPLPFISAGGSNLVVAMISVGILVNIALHSERPVPDDHTRVIKDSVHWA